MRRKIIDDYRFVWNKFFTIQVEYCNFLNLYERYTFFGMSRLQQFSPNS